MKTESEKVRDLAAPHATGEQMEQIYDAIDRLQTIGESDAALDDWLPDHRYDAATEACEMIEGYEALADRVAAAEGRTLADGGLENDPLTQALHDVYSEAHNAAMEDEGEATYKIRRSFFRGGTQDVEGMTGLTLEEAQAHCQRDDTREAGVWFDCYTEE